MSLLPLTKDTLTLARGRAQSAFSGFTAGQKVITALAGVGLIVAGVVFMNIESRPSYQPLFTNLQAADAGAVTAQLTASKIPYQLSNGGSTVLVPAAYVNQERVALAAQGLPSSGTVGFTNLEKSGITTSQFVQQIEYQQALEGQLQQTIESIQGIQSAQVSLVVPAQSAFVVANQPTTTASILVNLLPGATLNSGQVQAIVHLAASATPGLTAANVTVVDNLGDVLSSPGGAASGTGSSNSEQTDAYDTQLANSIEAVLARTLGVGNSAVQVHAVLDFNQQSTTTSGLQTDAQGKPILAPTSRNTTSSSYTGTGTPPSGVLGSSAPPTTTSSSGNYTSTSSQVTNAVGQVTQTVNQAPGQVVKTSIAVLLNSAATPRPDQAKVSALVTAAAGLNSANGDQLVVTSMPFAKVDTSPAAALAAASASANQRQMIRHVAEGAALVLLLVVLLFFALRAARRSSYDEVQLTEFASPPARVFAMDEHRRVEPLEAVRSPALEAAPAALLSQVNAFVEQRPAEVARLLRVWADEQSSESL
jgi:flagellar M-ring protein FliF